MTTVVCDVTENADASSSVVLGFTDVLLQAAVCISLLAPGITLSVTATADALSFVSADKSFEISTTADATSTATSQLNGLELIRETTRSAPATPRRASFCRATSWCSARLRPPHHRRSAPR
jgi:hypothetical protein